MLENLLSDVKTYYKVTVIKVMSVVSVFQERQIDKQTRRESPETNLHMVTCYMTKVIIQCKEERMCILFNNWNWVNWITIWEKNVLIYKSHHTEKSILDALQI